LPERIPIREEDRVHDEWYQQAEDMTVEELPEFIRKLTEDYSHDYGTICHAIAAAAVGAAWAVENSPQGGITGFQGGAVMWEFIRCWKDSGTHVPYRLVNYEDLLYPQYENKFTSITPDIWNKVRSKADELLASNGQAASRVKQHWTSISEGNIPFGLTISQE